MNVKLTSNVFICIYMPEMSISLSETGRSVYVSDSLPPCFFNILASGPTNNNKHTKHNGRRSLCVTVLSLGNSVCILQESEINEKDFGNYRQKKNAHFRM